MHIISQDWTLAKASLREMILMGHVLLFLALATADYSVHAAITNVQIMNHQCALSMTAD